MKENYLAKWLNNELSGEELKSFENSEEFASYQRLIKASGRLQAPSFDVDKAFEDLQQRKGRSTAKVISISPFQKFMRVAAAVAVIVVTSYFYINSLNESISTDYAQRTEVVLPDNSEVFLNADSQISYSERKWDKERSITLEGEAFFKVAKGKKFQVATEEGIVTVLGTQFNVEQREAYFEVSCYEGLVSVLYNGKETKLPAGAAFLVIEGKVIPTTAQESVVPSWMNKESSFRSIPLAYVLEELERQFNIEVKTENIDLDQLFTGTFSNTNLNLALQSLSAPSEIQFKVEGKQVLFYAEKAP